jgi:hypothetical protein
MDHNNHFKATSVNTMSCQLETGIMQMSWAILGIIMPLHTMVEGREVVDFHQLDCKKPRIKHLDPSH